MKKLIIISLFVLLFSSFSFANTENEKSITLIGNYNSEEFKSQINNALQDDSIDSVNVIYDDLLFSQDIDLDVKEFKLSKLKRFPKRKIVRYTARGRKFVKKETGKDSIAYADASYPDTIKIGTSKSVSRKYSCGFNVSAQSISAAVLFDVTKTKTIYIEGSTKVPKYHKKKRVKLLKYNAYPVFKVYRFSVDKITSLRGLTYKTKDFGKGYAYTPIGFSFKKTYVYKK